MKSNENSRFSRQKYAIGSTANNRLSNSKICIIGYNGLSQEIIRNLVIMGVSSIDFTENCYTKLKPYQKTSLYFTKISDFQTLNPNCKINNIDLNEKQLDFTNYDVVLLVNSPISFAEKINDIIRETSKETKFIYTCCYGLMGFHYTDVGESCFIENVDGKESVPIIIDTVTNEHMHHVIKCKDEHKLNDGDTVFINQTGTEYKVTKNNPYEFTIQMGVTTLDVKTITKKIISKTITGTTIKNSLMKPTFHIADYSKPFKLVENLLDLVCAYEKYFIEFGEDPIPWNIDDYEKFKQYVPSTVSDELSKKFCFTIRGDFLPLASIVGGIVSHEVVKIVSKICLPIIGWCFEECYDVIGEIFTIMNNELDQTNDSDGLINSTTTVSENSNASCDEQSCHYIGLTNIFGNEFLNKLQQTKPFIVGSGAIGCELLKNLAMLGIKNITVTDNDSIEKSNLSRQFLFNDSDIGKSKSIVASEKVMSFNPLVSVHPYTIKACRTAEHIFTNDFYESTDIILNALDNIEARKYTDTKAVKHHKPLIDSGTVGVAGSLQIVIPDKTISYNSITDTADKTIPICTIKSFPYLQAHTIQWAREIFESEFNEAPKSFMNLQTKSFQYNKTQFAETLIYKYFYENIKKLIEETEENGNPANKTMPQLFELTDLNNVVPNEMIETIYTLHNQMVNEIMIQPIDFDKENETHIEFIKHFSNLRNKQYGIEEATTDTIHKISGNIIPAMITTTAVISGYQVIEFIKIIKNSSVFVGENRELNLNFGYNSGVEIVKAPVSLINGHELTLWSRFFTKSNKTKTVVEEVETKYGSSVYIMTCGNTVVYEQGINSEVKEEIDFTQDVSVVFNDVDVVLPIMFL